MNNELLSVLALLAHLIVGVYIFKKLFDYWIPDEYTPEKQIRENVRK